MRQNCLSKTTRKLPKSHQKKCPMNNVMYEEKAIDLDMLWMEKGPE